MFKTYCGDCGNSWYIGNPRTCTCPWKDALKPEWVGLTLDERIELAQDVDWAIGAYCEYAEKIEAKLRSKNESKN